MDGFADEEETLVEAVLEAVCVGMTARQIRETVRRAIELQRQCDKEDDELGE